ncbi:peptide ligase PGM1-related protein [Mesorhizobium sp. M0136]|uniref:preATP grasp domain-containing protein n=1 Tax=Mesorhizobium sp. M0136 TaxID=2956890 RepID=UPI00333C0C16
MSAVILANFGSDVTVPAVDLLSDADLKANAVASKQMIWFAQDNDILVTPTPVTHAFLEYTNLLKGGSKVTTLSVSPEPTKRPLPISAKHLEAGSHLCNSLTLLARHHVSCLKPSIADGVSACIAELLGDVPVMFPHANGPASPEATRLLNDKAKFREFAPPLGVPIARGSICVCEREMANAICRLLSDFDHAILKMARHSGGKGNVIISKGVERSLQGATRSVSIPDVDLNLIRAALHDIGLVATQMEPVIVEVYSENESSIGVHFDIGTDRVDLVGVASIRLNPGYGGTYWSKSLADDLPKDVMSWCHRLGDYAQQIGYVGPLSVDVVKGKEVGFFACEVNGRHGSFSLIRAVSTSVGFEPALKDGECVALSRIAVPIDVRFSDLVDLLEKSQLHYKPSVKRGAIVITDGYDGTGPFDFVSVGRDLREAKEIEYAIVKLAK